MADAEPVWFAVEHAPIGDVPALYRGHLPKRHDRRYVLRLDTLPAGERWLDKPLAELFAVYIRLRRLSRLPPASFDV